MKQASNAMNFACILLRSALLQTVIGQRHLYKYIKTDGSFYFISNNRSTFDKASGNCLDTFNGHVASFDNHPYNITFLPLLLYKARYLIGLNYDASEEFYKWQHNGLKVDYNNITIHALKPVRGDCVVLSHTTGSWELRNVNCTKKFRYICRSYDPTCSVINIDGFQNKTQFNGNYTMTRDIQAFNECDSTKPIYMKIIGDEFICNRVNYTPFFLYGMEPLAAIITSVPFPHLAEFERRSRIYELDSQANWTELTVKITCLTFNVPKGNLIVNTPTTPDVVLQQHMLTIVVSCAALAAVLLFVVTSVSVMCRRRRHGNTVPVSDDKYENVSKRKAPTASPPSNADLNTTEPNNTSANLEDRSTLSTDANSIDNSPYVNVDNRDENIYTKRDNHDEITYANHIHHDETTYVNCDYKDDFTYFNSGKQGETPYVNCDKHDEVVYVNHDNQNEIVYNNDYVNVY